MSFSLLRRWVALVATIAVLTTGLVAIDVADPSPAAAGDDGSLDLSFGGPDEILLGESATYSLEATNNGSGGDLFNVSYRLVLPAGATVASTDLGNPDLEIADAPNAGETTYVWINVEDVQANVTKSHSVTVDFSHPTWDVSDLPELTAGAYASADARQVPDFDTADGTHNDNTDTAAFDVQTDETNIIAIRITKEEPNAESELLRGVHDEWTTYSLTIQNNFVNPSDTVVVDDYLPAGLEFLSCGAVDNTTARPITNPLGAISDTDEYVGAGALGAGVTPSDPTGGPTAICLDPDLVETVTLAADEVAPGQPAGVYTHVQWVVSPGAGIDPADDGILLAGENFELMYAAGIPLRQNEIFDGAFSPNTTGDQTANLDNNTGPLTADEQQWENWSLVSGKYDPSGRDLDAEDVDSHIVIAEDLSIHKTVDTSTYVQGTVSRWTLLIETGEYRDATSLIVTDTLPDGLCPLLVSGNPETAGTINTECDAQAGQEPETAGVDDAIDIVTENADGSWTLVWNTLPVMDESDDFTITLSTVAREFYQEANEDDLPVVAGDSWSNSVAIIGTTDPLNDGNGNEADRPNEIDTIDASAAGQSTSTVVITKRISEPALAGAALACDSATYVQSTFDPTDAIAFMDRGYKPGDRVCYRLDVDFTLDLDFRNPTVTDFIPPNTTFEQFWGTDLATGATAANEVTIVSATPTDFPVLGITDGVIDAVIWELGDDIAADDGGPNATDTYVDETSDQFQVIFSVIVNADPRDSEDIDLVENLAKLTHQNSAHLGGETFSSRDLADFPFVEPHLSLDKRNALTGETLDDDREFAVQGSRVDYSVTVTNDVVPLGDAAQDDHSAATTIPVWDILPDLTTCAFITGGTLSVTGPDGAITATCYDDGDGGYPLDGQSTDGRSVIVWDIPRLDPGESATAVYSIDIPVDYAAGILLVNDAGVLSYDQPTDNTGGNLTYVPSSNIDEDAPASNIGPVEDQAEVEIAPISIVKRQTSSVTETDNRSNTPSATNTQDAAIGETIEYDFTITFPEGADLHDAVFTDPLDDELDFVSLDDGSISLDNGGTSTPLTIDSATLGDGHFDLGGGAGYQAATDILVDLVGETLTITLPAFWDNGPGELDDLLDLEFTVLVMDVPAAVDNGNIDNRVFGTWRTLPGGGGIEIDTQSNRARTKLIEPELTIDKDVQVLTPAVEECEATDDADECDTTVGATHRFTLTIENEGTGPAHDLTVVDTLPADGTLVPTNFTGGTPVYSAGARTLTWTLAGPIVSGGTATLTYDVTVGPSADLTDDEDLVNTADVTSYWGMSTADRAAALDPDEVPEYGDTRGPVTEDSVTLTVEFPDLVIEKEHGPGMDPTDARVGEAYTWDLVVTNNGAVTAFDIDVDDTLPTDWEYVPGTAELDTGSGFGALGDPTGGVTGPLVWTDVVASLDAGDEFTIRLDTVPTASLEALISTGTFDHVNDSGVNGDDAGGSSSNGTGSYGDDDGAGEGAFESDDNSARIRRIDLEVDKAIVETAPHHFGENITYRITVTNDHPTLTMDTASGVIVRDTLPAGVIHVSDSTTNGDYDEGTDLWTLATDLADGESATLDIVVRINSETAITNHAEVEDADQWDVDSDPGNFDDGTGPSEDDDDSVTFTPVSADLGNRIWFDLDADGEQDAGEPGISGVTVTATWIDPADGVTVVTRTQVTDDEGEYGFDDLPRNVDITVTVDAGTLPGGVSQTFELDDDPDLTDTQQNNREAGALDGEVADIELDATTPSYPDVDFGYVGTGAIGDTVWLDLDDDGVLDADEVGIPGVTVTVVWGGPDGIVGTDDDVTFTDVTDADGEYLVEGLPGGEYEVSIDPATLPAGVVPTHDLDGGDDRTTEVTLGDGETRLDVDFGERPEADLAIDKSSSGEFAVGSENTWTITVTNNGPAATSGTVTVTDELPDGTTFVRGDTTDWACAASGQTVTCELIGSLAVSASSIIPVIVELSNEVGGDSLTNSASIEDVGGHVDPVPENDEDDDTVGVPLSILGIDKALVEDEIISDGTATWRITVTNYGPSATTGTVTVVDELPTTLGFVRGDSTDFACSAGGQTVTCNADTVMAVGDEIVVDIVTVVNAEPGVSITNSAGVLGGTTVSGDPLPEDVLDDIRDELEDGLDDALDVSVPTDVGGDAETPPSPALAFTGSDSDRLLGLAFALVALGVAFMAVARRRKPALATTN